MVEPQDGGTYSELVAAAQWAEKAGLVAFARSDHYYNWETPGSRADDAFTALGGIARETSTIDLVLLVSPVTFRHPAVIAKSAATLNEMSDGRFSLGLGTGWMDIEHEVFGLPFPQQSERFSRLTEAIHYIKAALRDEHAKFDGDFYQIDAEVRPLAPEIGFVIGGTGKVKTPALAGEHADEYNQLFRPTAEVGERISTMRKAAESAGRDPSTIRTSLMGPAIVGSDDDDLATKLAVRAEQRGISADELHERYENAGLIVGTPSQAKARLRELEEVGVDRAYIQCVPHSIENVEATFAHLI